MGFESGSAAKWQCDFWPHLISPGLSLHQSKGDKLFAPGPLAGGGGGDEVRCGKRLTRCLPHSRGKTESVPWTGRRPRSTLPSARVGVRCTGAVGPARQHSEPRHSLAPRATGDRSNMGLFLCSQLRWVATGPDSERAQSLPRGGGSSAEFLEVRTRHPAGPRVLLCLLAWLLSGVSKPTPVAGRPGRSMGQTGCTCVSQRSLRAQCCMWLLQGQAPTPVPQVVLEGHAVLAQCHLEIRTLPRQGVRLYIETVAEVQLRRKLLLTCHSGVTEEAPGRGWWQRA